MHDTNPHPHILRRAPLAASLGAITAIAACAALPAAAVATPQVQFKARPVPIPGFKHTGNILGAGTNLEVTFTISGTEYDGGPEPITHVNVAFPKGTKITRKGFKTCPTSTLERHQPEKCPKKSKAGPAGEAHGFVTFGSERVPETVKLQPYYSPSGINFWVEGRSPTVIELVSVGRWMNAPAPFGPQISTNVPLIETVPGAADGSTTSIRLVSGGAYRKGRHTVYYGTMPRRCPKGGFPYRVEVTFLGGATQKLTGKVACPGGGKHHGRNHRR